ncbi:MAG: FtsX-like permease family protein [Acidobacteriota bacterium]
MTGTLYLAWRYLVANPLKTGVLFLTLTLSIYLPVATNSALERLDESWRERAAQTPLVVGAKGSRFDLTMHALYFRGTPPQTIAMDDLAEIQDSGYAAAFPLYIPGTTSSYSVVGTRLSYLDFRGLQISEGKALTFLGDCVLGANVAADLGAAPGDRLLTDPVNVFHIAGAYPLDMHISGILKRTGTPDDDVVFVDLKTAWVIAGIGHGHVELDDDADEALVLERRDGTIVANASLVEYTRITEENRASFHFHEKPENLPISAIIADPDDERSATLLRGRYLSPSSETQILVPSTVVDEILELVFRVGRILQASYAVIIAISAIFLALVVSLSIRLRKGEMETLRLIGGSRWVIFQMHLYEYLTILLAAVLASALLDMTTGPVTDSLVRSLLLKR